MGMDIYGCMPQSEKGEYIRHSASSWNNVLENGIKVLSPKHYDRVDYWCFNDGDGLGAYQSCELAEKIDEGLFAGKITDTELIGYLKELSEFLTDCGGFIIS